MSHEAPEHPTAPPQTSFEKGVGFLQSGNLDAAERCFRKTLEGQPQSVEALFNLGLVILRRDGPEQARPLFEECLRLQPQLQAASTQLARCLLALDQPAKALALLSQAAAGCHQDINTLNTLGLCHLAMNQAREAEVVFTRALNLHPAHPGILCNLGAALREQNHLEEAIRTYEALLRLEPGQAQARLNLALCLLGTGRLAEAWPHFEARKTLGLAGSARRFPGTPWFGNEPIRGRHLLLHAEQGMGDTLQFLRYLPRLRDAGARLHLEVQAPLLPLLRRLPFLESIHAAGDPLPPVDLHCALPSLPGIFASDLGNLPSPNPGLPPDPEQAARMAALLPPTKQRSRIGVVWAGSRLHPNDRQRSLPLQSLMEGLQDLPFEWLSLQTDLSPQDQQLVQSLPGLQHLGHPLKDFRDSAALLQHIDLLVSVDTAFAHLAGVLGKPAFILLAKAPDWRWLLNRADSPWYPSLRLFRQQNAGEWGPPLAELREALTQAFHQG